MLTSPHYGGDASGRSITDNVIKRILALTVSDLQNLFCGLPTPIIERNQSFIKEVAQTLLAKRDVRIENVSRILQILELRVGADASRRKPPAVELIGTNTSASIAIAVTA